MENWKGTGTKPPPHSGPEFENMMREVDAALVAEGHSIPNRPILAGRNVSLKYQVPVPITSDPSHLPPELRPFAPLGEAINQWYENTYGDRLKVDMLPGRAVVQLDGDLYVLRVPRIFGRARFVMSRTFLPAPTIGRGPAICNIVELVDDLTPAKAALLSDESLQHLNDIFDRALSALYTLERAQHDLLSAARGDLATAVYCLMERGDRFGESKWASLQAAEKILKAAIALQGATFEKTHNLAELCAALRDAGIPFDELALVQSIQCSPAIRYGQEACSQPEAVAAHHASLALVNGLRDAGAKFELGLG